MESAQTISSIGSLIGDPTRSIVLASLLDGRAWTAGELAMAAGVTPQTISSHLAMLVGAGLLHRESQGRHRYFRLSSPEVANMLESLTVIATWSGRKPARRVNVPPTLRKARTCYDHLAGELGVGIAESMIQNKLLNYGDTDFTVTPKGNRFFADLDIDCEELKTRKRKFAHQCLDWSERKYHIAGALGAEIYKLLSKRNWVRADKPGRVVRLTPTGARALQKMLGMHFS
jgi:DNA-binding transcriptional ArsR family regulator